MSNARQAVVQSAVNQADNRFRDWNNYWKKNLSHFATSEDKEIVLLILRNITEVYQDVAQTHQIFVDAFDKLARASSSADENHVNSHGNFSDTRPVFGLESQLSDSGSLLSGSLEPELEQLGAGGRRDTLKAEDFSASLTSLVSVDLTPPTDSNGMASATPVSKKNAFRNYMRASSTTPSVVSSGLSRSKASAPALYRQESSTSTSSSPQPAFDDQLDRVSLRGPEITADVHERVSVISRRDSIGQESIGRVSVSSATTNVSLHENYSEMVDDYNDLDLKEEILRGLDFFGARKPTLVQRKAIVPLLESRNVIIEAPERSGKAGVCATALLQRLDSANPDCQIVICTASAFSVDRFKTSIKQIGQYIKPKMHVCEKSVGLSDVKRLQNDQQIVIATPDTVDKLCAKRAITLKNVKMFIIDNASELKDAQQALRDVFIRMPPDVQVVVFATQVPVAMFSTLKKFVKNPVCIMVSEKEWARSTAGDFWHGFYNVRQDEWKIDAIKALLRSRTLPYVHGKTLILCRRPMSAPQITSELKKNGIVAFNMDQRSTKDLPDEFVRAGSAALVMNFSTLRSFASEIRSLKLIVNYDLPGDLKDYVYGTQQLLGSTTVADKFKGYVVSFVTSAEGLTLRAIQEYLDCSIEEIDSKALSDLKKYRR